MTRAARRAQVRAALLAVVIGYSVVLAVPTPRPQTAESVRQANVRTELHEWLPWARRLGLADTEEALAAWVVRWSQRLDGWRVVLLTPIRPFLTFTRTGQRWMLFSSPSATMHQLVVRGRRAGGDWEPLYVRNDPQHAWMGAVLDYRRMRTIYEASSRAQRPEYEKLGRWLADRAFAEDATLEALRVGQRRWHAARPDDPARTSANPTWVLGLTFYPRVLPEAAE